MVEEGTIELRKYGLENRIVAAMGLGGWHKTHGSPAEFGSLGKDFNGEPCNEHFNYASIVGMYWYSSNNSHPDLHMAVSQ